MTALTNRYIILIVAVAVVVFVWWILRQRKTNGTFTGTPSSGYIVPVRGPISSRFGMRVHPVNGEYKMHNGIDFAVPTGTPVRAIASGIVQTSKYSNTAGNMIQLKHPNGFVSEYFHLSVSFVSNGTPVSQGDVIANSGNTGTSTGPHLHLGIKNATGAYLDPESLFSV